MNSTKNNTTILLSIEGTEGAGKSSTIAALSDFAEQHGIDIVFVREPGGTPIAEAIRDVFKDSGGRFADETMDVMTELYLMYAQRNQLLTQVVAPSLKQGKHVISDRTWLSGYAYQQVSDDIYFSVHDPIMKHAPKITHLIYLDATPEVGMKRARGRGELDRIEQKAMTYFHKVRERYIHVINNIYDGDKLIINTEVSDQQQTAELAINYLKKALNMP